MATSIRSPRIDRPIPRRALPAWALVGVSALCPAGASAGASSGSTAPVEEWDWASVRHDNTGLKHCTPQVVGSFVGDEKYEPGLIRFEGNPGAELDVSLWCVAPATYTAQTPGLGEGQITGAATPDATGSDRINRHPLGRRWSLKFDGVPRSYTFEGRGPWGIETITIVLSPVAVPPKPPPRPAPEVPASPCPAAPSSDPSDRRWGGAVSVGGSFGTLYDRYTWSVRGALDWIVPAFGPTAPADLLVGTEVHYASLRKPTLGLDGLTGGDSPWNSMLFAPHLGVRLRVRLDGDAVGLVLAGHAGVGWQHFWDMGSSSNKGEPLSDRAGDYVATLTGTLRAGLQFQRLFEVGLAFTGEKTLADVRVLRPLSGLEGARYFGLKLGYLGLDIVVGRL